MEQILIQEAEKKSFGETYTSDNGLVYAMNIKFTKANIDPNEFAVHSGNMTYNDGNKKIMVVQADMFCI